MSQPSNGKGSQDDDVPRRFRHALNRLVFSLGLLLTAIGLTGELLGWFDAVGVLLFFLGMAASALALLDDRSDVLHEDHASLHANQERRLENQAAMIDQLERIDGLLDDRLPDHQA